MKSIKLLVTAIALLALASPAFAAKDKAAKADKGEAKERTVTITGEGKCAKCALKKGDKCQNVIEADNKKGKKVTYYLTDNDVAKEFHKNICKESKQVSATGTAKKGTEKGTMELTATKIEAK